MTGLVMFMLVTFGLGVACGVAVAVAVRDLVRDRDR